MALFSFTKADRLLKRHEFLRLSKIGTKLSNAHFIVILSPGLSNRVRLGITVSKKVGCATVRSRLRRLSREHFRLNRYKIDGNWDISLIAKKAAADLSSEQVFFSLKEIFDRISRNLEP